MMYKLIIDLNHKFNQWHNKNTGLPEIIRYTSLCKDYLVTRGSIYPKGIDNTENKDIITFYIKKKGFVFCNVEDDMDEVSKQLICEWLEEQEE